MLVTTKVSLWRGVYPAATTQFAEDGSVDIDATQRVLTALVDDGVDGLILLGTCGENNSLEPAEKRQVIAARQMGVRCFALSLITNISATAESDHAEVLATGRAAAERVQRLLAAMLSDPSLYSA